MQSKLPAIVGKFIEPDVSALITRVLLGGLAGVGWINANNFLF